MNPVLVARFQMLENEEMVVTIDRMGHLLNFLVSSRLVPILAPPVDMLLGLTGRLSLEMKDDLSGVAKFTIGMSGEDGNRLRVPGTYKCSARHIKNILVGAIISMVDNDLFALSSLYGKLSYSYVNGEDASEFILMVYEK